MTLFFLKISVIENNDILLITDNNQEKETGYESDKEEMEFTEQEKNENITFRK